MKVVEWLESGYEVRWVWKVPGLKLVGERRDEVSGERESG